ncbi:MAG: PilZ domain-containing protein [Bacillota bacterium]|nr:PilZ domain-containing protein [Bacillota bacterium]
MKENKITIGNGNTGQSGSDKDSGKSLQNKQQTNKETNDSGKTYRLEQIDEKLWGNDSIIEEKIDQQFLTDRRLFVRVRYFLQVECRERYEEDCPEPVQLKNPIKISIIDISSGGVGAVCEHEIPIGTILPIKLLLEGTAYEIKYKVVYCIQNDDKFRIGLKIEQKDRIYCEHLKIYVAKLSLRAIEEP